MAEVFVAHITHAPQNTWMYLLFVEPVIFVGDDVINNIVPHIETEMLVNTNICVGIFFHSRRPPTYKCWISS
jgi:hypothetical protein